MPGGPDGPGPVCMAIRGSRNRAKARGRFARIRGKRGVVSVVGTLLALLVFFALFGIFITQYVPLWMTDNESQFTSQTQTSFAELKAGMDQQAALGTNPVYSTPFVMSSANIPLFAQSTAAVMNFVPQSAGVFANVSSTVGPGGGKAFYQNYSLGTLILTIPNRYYSPQTFEYEDDAVIQSQADTHQVVAYPPELAFNDTGGKVGVTLELFQLVGNATQTVSSGTVEVYSHYRSTQEYYSQSLTGATFSARFLLGTHYACAWQAFLAEVISTSNLPAGTATLTPSGCVASQNTAQDVTLSLSGLSDVTLIVAAFQIVVGVGVE